MKTEDSQTRPEMLQGRLDLLRLEEAGQVTELPCPDCGRTCVSVWYTQRAPREYRTWFVCENCGFELRAQNAERPRHYSVERDRTGHRASK
jgi:predicted RNA-binding Zn-ribbon protein involved in translation (DUF1610 family)